MTKINRTITLFSTLLVIAWTNAALASLTCETSHPENPDPVTLETDPYFAMADCIIEMNEGVSFVVESGNHAQLIAEQRITLKPGFHAKAGSTFKAYLRDCVRNPNAGTGFTSWGSEGDNGWMDNIISGFEYYFNQDSSWNIDEKYDDITSSIRVYFQDPGLITAGLDDIHGTHNGIDEGVLHFHVAHGRGIDTANYTTRFDVRAPSQPTEVVELGTSVQEMLLGNCDGTRNGELRYFLLCSCRPFSHGPWFDTTNGDQCDRPSEFDPTDPDHFDVTRNVGPILSENLRMACGVSTNATCSGGDAVDPVGVGPDGVSGTNWRMVEILWDYYHNQGYDVAEAWGNTYAGIHKGYLDLGGGVTGRDVWSTPLCIAVGNADGSDFRSPITDDHRFSNKANPYDGAFHVVSWETTNSLNREEQFLTSSMPTSFPAMIVDTQPYQMPALNGVLGISEAEGPMMVSREKTLDGRPLVRIDKTKRAVYIAGEKKRLKAQNRQPVLTTEEYLQIARQFVAEQGWDEPDIGPIRAVKSVLQVIPKEKTRGMTQVVKTLKNITFRFRRALPIQSTNGLVRGMDNQILVQLNRDGTIKNASKRWNQIDRIVEGIPVKSYSEAYTEALHSLDNPDNFKLSSWDWGYQSVESEISEKMMLMHYYFVFESVVSDAKKRNEPVEVAVRGHILN